MGAESVLIIIVVIIAASLVLYLIITGAILGALRSHAEWKARNRDRLAALPQEPVEK